MSNASQNAVEVKGRLDNAQRKALAEIVEQRMERRIDAARQAERQLEEQITAELARRFRVGAIQIEIQRLEKQKEIEAKRFEQQIANLKERRSELGFGYCRYDDSYTIEGGRARKLLELKVSNRSLAVQRLTDRKMALIQALWLAPSLGHAEVILADLDREEAA